MLRVPPPGSDTGCSSRDVQSRSLSIMFSRARCRACSLQGIEACLHRVRGLCRSVHSTKLVCEQKKPRTDDGEGWMMLMCFQASKFSNFSTTKTGLNSNVNHPRQNVPTVQTPRPKELYFCRVLDTGTETILSSHPDYRSQCQHIVQHVIWSRSARSFFKPQHAT